MKYGRLKLPFSVRDVRNYPPGIDLTGLEGHFSFRYNREGNPRRVVDVIIPALSYRQYPPNPDDLDEADLVAMRPADMKADAQEERAPVELSNEQRVALALFVPVIKLISLSPDGEYRFLDEQQKYHNLLYVLSAETVEVERAVEELEGLMNAPKARPQSLWGQVITAEVLHPSRSLGNIAPPDVLQPLKTVFLS